MTPGKATATTAIVFGAFLATVLATAPQGQTPASGPGAAQPAQGRGAAGGQGAPGGGRGRGNATATLWADQCAGCHGNDAAGGRAPSLFDEVWLKSVSDDRIVNSITNGVPDTEMEPFGKALSSDQIWSLVNYIRSQTGALRPRPEFVENPNGAVITSAKQTVRVETVTEGLETPWALEFLPDGRMLITERPGRLRIWANGKLSDPVKGTPAVHAVQDGGLLDVIAHPNYAQNGWIYLAYSEVQPGFTAPPRLRRRHLMRAPAAAAAVDRRFPR